MKQTWSLTEFTETRELGRGAQGRVVLARHRKSGALVAIKYLERAAPEALAGLRAEAQMLGRLRSPHVVRLYQFVETPQGAAIVMEAVNGVSLRAILDKHGALAPEAALTVLKGSLLGLAAAHSVGVVHRDYKPANVVVREDGLSKLVDFGVAALAGQGSSSGTPAYMAPEQWRGEPASPATDVYAATGVFLECVTGRRPFAGVEAAALMHHHLNVPVPLDDVPEPLRPLIARGMAKDPGQRPPGAAAFVAELEATARAAYGPDWERRGIGALAGAAVALASLFPLTALAVTPAGAAVAGGSVASSVGQGLLATAAGKVTIAVAGTAVVAASAGTVTYATRDASPAPRPSPAAVVTTATESWTSANPRVVLQNAQYVRVSGLRDAALQQRINRALRAPLDRLIKMGREHAARSRTACEGRPTQIYSTVRLGVRGPALVSVRYRLWSDWCQAADGMPAGEVVTIDLRTGRRLTATDVFRPQTLTPTGLSRLQSLVVQREPDPPWSNCAPEGRFTRKHFGDWTAPAGDREPPMLSAFFTPSAFELAWHVSGSDGCQALTFTAPYAKVRDLLQPSVLSLLNPSPTPS